MCEENRLELETERYDSPDELTYYTVHGQFLKMTKFSFYADDWDTKLLDEEPEPRNLTARDPYRIALPDRPQMTPNDLAKTETNDPRMTLNFASEKCVGCSLLFAYDVFQATRVACRHGWLLDDAAESKGNECLGSGIV